MSDHDTLMGIMRNMTERLAVDPDDGEAAAILDRVCELLHAIWLDEQQWLP